MGGFPKSRGYLYESKKNSLEHANQTGGASKNQGAVFLDKSMALITPVRHVGLSNVFCDPIQDHNITIHISTARAFLVEVFHPLVRWEGPDLDLRVRSAAAPAPAPATSGDLGFCPFGIQVETNGFQTACLVTGQKFS